MEISPLLKYLGKDEELLLEGTPRAIPFYMRKSIIFILFLILFMLLALVVIFAIFQAKVDNLNSQGKYLDAPSLKERVLSSDWQPKTSSLIRIALFSCFLITFYVVSHKLRRYGCSTRKLILITEPEHRYDFFFRNLAVIPYNDIISVQVYQKLVHKLFFKQQYSLLVMYNKEVHRVFLKRQYSPLPDVMDKKERIYATVNMDDIPLSEIDKIKRIVLSANPAIKFIVKH